MKLVLPFAVAGLLALTTPVFAQSAFDGVWKIDLASAQLPDKPYVVSLQDGVYTCTSCVPVYSIPADGQMHRVEGFDYWDEMSVQAVDGHRVDDAQKLKGRMVGTSRTQISADGATMITTWADTSAPDGTTSTGESRLSRIAAGPSGSHAISGSWKSEAVANVSDVSLLLTLMLKDGVFSLRQGNGYALEARLDGPAAPVTGDLAGATARVRQLADGSIEETDHINGEAVSVMTMTPTPDGQMSVKIDNLKSGTSVSYKLIKQ